MQKLNIESISLDELKNFIKDIVDGNLEIIKDRGMRAMGPLMGEAMKELRGKIDGEIISKELKSQIEKKLKEMN